MKVYRERFQPRLAIRMSMADHKRDEWLLAGDFNGGMGSSVHRYLVGDQSLNGCEANPYWDELATGYQALSGEPIRATLDVIHNPRWRGDRPAYPPIVMDRIYTMEHGYDISLESHYIFGTDISPENQLSASDHYGVAAEITFDADEEDENVSG